MALKVAEAMVLEEPIELEPLAKMVHQVVRCCYFGKTKQCTVLDRFLDVFSHAISTASMTPDLVLLYLDIFLSNYKMGMMLSSTKGHKITSKILLKLLKICPVTATLTQSDRLKSSTFLYLNSMLSLLVASNEYYEPSLLLLDLIKTSELAESNLILQKYFEFLLKNCLTVDFDSLKALSEALSSLGSLAKPKQHLMESGILIGKTIGNRVVSLTKWDAKSIEAFFSIVGQLLQIVRSYEKPANSATVEGFCKECNNVKRHVIIKLVCSLEKVVEIVGKQGELTKRIIEKFTSLIEYVLSTVIDGLKCSSKKSAALNFLAFIYNMVAVWKFFGESRLALFLTENNLN